MKVNKKTRGNIRKYEQKVRELRGYIKRTNSDTQQAYKDRRQQTIQKRDLKAALARVKRDGELTRTKGKMEAGGTARTRRNSKLMLPRK